MREPLEDYKLLVSRAKTKVKFDTKFLFISAMNPCPCGNLLMENNSCRCNDLEIKRYKSRLSEPFLDRIDLYVVMNESNTKEKATYSSKQFHTYVIEAFKKQKLRGQKELNGKLNDEDILKYCVLNQECKDVLDKATINFNLSFRSINKVLKVSRTIADLHGCENIEKKHLFEALSYRRR